ncbi:hypothetical protein TREMEDRAFT_19145, partial [Tremella mesenterica DSM 1558]|uniref:uncharacterized protein n=1 Tax=Tremella mesenterica (strain ATCC 24925 / CBS 8224 / DSM 1558 / NBRC 9311 / NRRL Y-6157 / RJB 2259-6 / UBC 559-6) TaxID=578456 RepID=UPI0003F49AED
KDPTNKGKRIHPNGRSDLCVTVQNGYAGIGSAVELSYCFANNDQFVKNQLWDYTVGQTGLIKLHGQNLCLDAGDNPGNAASLKVWTCYDGLLQQTWNFQTANVLSLPNSGYQCLDVVSGSQPGTQKPYNSVGDLQTWECSTNNDPQQIFYQL